MAHKLLIALDSSEGAWRAVEYVAETFGKTPDVQVTLLHILSGLPPALWDDGHILGDKERQGRTAGGGQLAGGTGKTVARPGEKSP